MIVEELLRVKDEEPHGRRGLAWTRLVHVALPWLVVGIIPAIFQLMYGVHDSGLVEEWPVALRFDEAGPVFWTPSDSSWLGAQAIRPLTVAPHAIAYLLDPNSFIWYHVIQALALGLKGVAMFALLIALRFRRSTAVLGALVLALFPAWDTLFVFRTLHIQYAVAFLLISLTCLISFHRNPTWPSGLGCAVAVTVSLALYEGGYIAVLLAPLVLLVEGRPKLKPFLLTCALWFSMPFVNGLRILQLLSSGNPLYQEAIIDKGPRRPVSEFWALVQRVIGKGFNSFIHPPWGFGISALTAMATACALVLFSALFYRNGRSTASSDEIGTLPVRTLGWIAVAGIVSAPVICLVFWPQPELLRDPLRIFSFSSISLTLTVVAVFEMAVTVRRSRIKSFVAVVIGCGLVTSTFAAAQAQRDEFHRDAVFEQHALGAMLAAIGDLGSGSTLVIIDPQYLTGRTVYRMIPETMNYAVSYLRRRTTELVVCHESIDALRAAFADQSAASGPPPAQGTCRLAVGTLQTNNVSIPLASATLVEIRHARADAAGWTGDPVRLDDVRQTRILPCAGDGTCDTGPEGVQARVVLLGSG